MKLSRIATVIVLSLFLNVLGFAANPAGAWKWTITPPGGEPIAISLKLEFKEGKLTGLYQSPFGEGPISKAVFKDDALSFEVERERDGNKFVVKYAGKLDGDTLKGTVELPSFDGSEPRKQEWVGKREK